MTSPFLFFLALATLRVLISSVFLKPWSYATSVTMVLNLGVPISPVSLEKNKAWLLFKESNVGMMDLPVDLGSGSDIGSGFLFSAALTNFDLSD